MTSDNDPLGEHTEAGMTSSPRRPAPRPLRQIIELMLMGALLLIPVMSRG